MQFDVLKLLTMYSCKICQYTSDSPFRYMQHHRVHSNMKTIPCGVAECPRHFSKLTTFYSHLSRDHRLFQRSRRSSILQNVGISVKCDVGNCQNVLPFTDLVKHLKGHIDAGISINCPVAGCGRIMRKKSSFSAHISIKHGCLNKLNIDKAIIHDSTVGSNDDSENEEGRHIGAENGTEHVLVDDVDGQDAADVDQVNTDALVHNIAMFLLKLQCQYHIPASTIEIIGSEMNSLHQLSAENTVSLLKSKLCIEGMQTEKIVAIISDLQRDDAFHIALNSDTGTLRSQHKRRSFYTDTLRYVGPQQYSLGYNRCNRACFYHYVPLPETLKSLLLDVSVQQCLRLATLSHSSTDVFEDICDGSVYKKISMTVATTSYLELILYQDEFSVVNPLGSAKKSHKILAFYLALGNLPHHLRMKIDNLQLVMLCYERDLDHFAQEKIFHTLITDLKSLEDSGITVNNRHWNVRLICVLGDNLGSHWIGGFSKNFSNNRFPCRYCLVGWSKNKKY